MTKEKEWRRKHLDIPPIPDSIRESEAYKQVLENTKDDTGDDAPVGFLCFSARSSRQDMIFTDTFAKAKRIADKKAMEEHFYAVADCATKATVEHGADGVFRVLYETDGFVICPITKWVEEDPAEAYEAVVSSQAFWAEDVYTILGGIFNGSSDVDYDDIIGFDPVL